MGIFSGIHRIFESGEEAKAEARRLSAKLYDAVEGFLSEHYRGDAFCELSEASASASLGIVGSALAGSHNLLHLKKDAFKSSVASSQEVLFEEADECVAANVDVFIQQSKSSLNFQNTLQQMIAEKQLENATIYKRAGIDKKFFSKIISTKNYVPKKQTVMALGLALELPLTEYERFLASAGYAFMPSSKFDLIIKFCVLHQIYNLMTVDVILNDHNEVCFAQR